MSKMGDWVQFLCEYCDSVGCELSELTDTEKETVRRAYDADKSVDQFLSDLHDEAVERELDADDGQPTEYEEWQDYMGGDDWDHGQYDSEEF